MSGKRGLTLSSMVCDELTTEIRKLTSLLSRFCTPGKRGLRQIYQEFLKFSGASPPNNTI